MSEGHVKRISESKEGGIPKESSVVIAAADSKNKKWADYVCKGEDDQIVINDAIKELEDTNGGKVTLLEGLYKISGSVIINLDSVYMNGFSYGSIIKLQDNTDADMIVIGDNSSVRSNIVVSNINLDGSYGTQTNTDLSGIRVTKNCKKISVYNCYIHDVSGHSIQLKSTDATVGNFNSINISGNRIWNIVKNGISIYYGANNISVTNNKIYGNQQLVAGVDTRGIVIDSGITGGTIEYVSIIGNNIDASGSGFTQESILIDGTATDFGKNIVISMCNINNANVGIKANYSQGLCISSNNITNISNESIYLNNVLASSISSNTLNSAITGVYAVGCKQVALSSNIIVYTDNSIVFELCDYNNISSNIIFNTQFSSLSLKGSRGVVCASNLFRRSSQAANNTYNAIDIVAYAGVNPVYNNINNNYIIDDGATKSMYGINEDTGGDYNLIHGNMIYGPVTGKINTTGINTIQADNM